MENQSSRSSEVEKYTKSLKRNKYSAKSIQTYTYALEYFTTWLNSKAIYRFQDVTEKNLEDYQLYMIDKNLTENTQSVLMRAVRNLFNWMEKEQQLFSNPTADLVVHKPSTRLPLVITEEEIKKLLAQPCVNSVLGFRNRAILEVGYACGLRRNELASLTIFDPDTTRQTLRVMGKGRKERVLPLGKHAAHWVDEYIKKIRPKFQADRIDEQALWLRPGGKPMPGVSIAAMMKRYGQQAKLSVNITPHVLRRTAATQMLHNGAHPVQIQLFLGHATMGHLSQYLRMTITEIKEMHEKSKVGK